MFTIFGILFLSIGIFLFVNSSLLFEVSKRYDNLSSCSVGSPCSIKITVDKKLTKNIFFYYEIRNFYQNHRRYFKSKSSEQLRGKDLGSSDVGDCDPVIYNKDLSVTVSIGGDNLDPNKVAFPCGIMAKSIFTDSFVLYTTDSNGNKGTQIDLSSSGIAWPDDKTYKFKNLVDKDKVQWLDVEDERFIVWMRAAATPTFRKLWARVMTLPIEKGDYIVEITNNWDTKKFEGEKHFIIAETNSFGGKNVFLSICYIVVGSICLIAAAAFIIRRLIRPKGILEENLN